MLQETHKTPNRRPCRSLTKFAAAISMALSITAQALPATADELTETLDIAYYDGEGFDDAKHRLDLIVPADQPAKATMLWIHGGAWAFGDRKMIWSSPALLRETGSPSQTCLIV